MRPDLRSGDRTAAVAASAPPYLRELDVVRWLTCIGVVTTHCVEIFGRGGTLTAALLSGLQASREVFFLLSGLVLAYRYRDRRPFPWRDYLTRRITWVLLPYLVWTGVYVAMSYPHPGSFALIARPTGSWEHQVGLALDAVLTGPGQLYYVAVLLQFFVLFPFVLGLLRRTTRVHLLVVVASVAAQIWLMGRVSETPATNRELWNYQMYLVLGVVAGARFETIGPWLRRHRRPLLAVVVAVVVGTESATVAVIHGGLAPGLASDPFQARFLASNVAVGVGLYLLGTWWVDRPRPPLLAAAVSAGSANSYGVYLSQAVYLDLLSFWGWKRVDPHVGWVPAAILAVVIVWCWAAAVSAVLTRTPLARAVGRSQRPARGTPATGRFEPRPAGARTPPAPDCQQNLSPS